MKLSIKKIATYIPISIGMRTFKTGLATLITALVTTASSTLTPIIGNPFYAIMGTVFSMQSTVANSFKLGIGRVLGTVVGALIGFIFASFELSSPPALGLAMMLVIITCGLLKINHSIFITFTLCLLIMLNPNRQGGLIHYTFFRSLDTALGVVVGVLVNRYIAPPDYLKNILAELELLPPLIKKTLGDLDKLPALKKELANLDLQHKNYTTDEKYDSHHFSNENLQKTIDACNTLYFHFQIIKNAEEIVKNYHAKKINETLTMLNQTIIELKGAYK